MKRNLFIHWLLIFLMLFSVSSFAWTHSVSLGYGGGEDINHHEDTNSGFLLSYKFYTLKEAERYRLMLDASIGKWHSSFAQNKDLVTVAASLDFRLYLLHQPSWSPYLTLSAGPAYLSDRHFGQNDQGANFAFQCKLAAGTELGSMHQFDLALNLLHYSNAYLFRPNEGYNIFYVVSFGYLF